MMKKMRKCVSCGAYTLSAQHCGEATKPAHPPKFTIEDRYAHYRRKMRER
ncbi:MAG: RNA-protein complex protein Nop10 [Candidatus Micrarchaeota archaeon]|nr:RNA-protein complex protein Nop10 [Candidatus Micrarchaeota archaeon]